MKRIAAALALAAMVLTIPTAASALPRTAEDFAEQIDICQAGLEMILDGASDEEEMEMFDERLSDNGWTTDQDMDDLLVLCSFYKRGYLYALAE